MWSLVVQELYKDLVLHFDGNDQERTRRSLMAISNALKRFEFTPRSLQLKIFGDLEFLPLKDLLLHLPEKSLQRLDCCGAWPCERAPLFFLYMHLRSLRNLRLDRAFFLCYNRLGDSISRLLIPSPKLRGGIKLGRDEL